MGDGFLNIKYLRLLALKGNKEVSVGVKVNNGLLFGFRRSPRGGGGAESMQFEDLSNKLSSIELVDEQDSWSWNLNEEGGFTVSSARRFIDDGICGINGSCTKWVNLIPIKVNILAWRVALNKLPTRFNMSLRGMEVSTMECPVCRVGNETSDHLFFSCSLAAAMISRLFKWWELPDMFFHSYHGWENWLDGLRLRKEVKEYLEATMFVLWWIIRNYRNKLIFSSEVPSKKALFDLVVYHSYVWCNARARRNIV
ncbi:RNA-directed DNA polymerase, eukaryota [Tanacetum coccineum]